MSVYFISLGRYIKVGYSENPERRCRNLFSSATAYAAPWDCPRGLADRELLGYVYGDKDDERHAHRALDEFAIGCEFFLNEPPLRDYIDRCLSVDEVLSELVVRPDGPAPWVGQVEPLPPEVQRAVDLNVCAALDRILAGIDA